MLRARNYIGNCLFPDDQFWIAPGKEIADAMFLLGSGDDTGNFFWNRKISGDSMTNINVNDYLNISKYIP